MNIVLDGSVSSEAGLVLERGGQSTEFQEAVAVSAVQVQGQRALLRAGAASLLPLQMLTLTVGTG